MYNKKIFFLFLIIFVLLIFPAAKKKQKKAELGVTFSWKGTVKGSNKSPEIRVTNIPKGTTHFIVTLKDLDVPNWNHGGGKVKNDNTGIIPAGALKNGYNGPNPPSGSHRYQFTVKAIDSKKKTIGIGKAVQSFP